MNKYQEALGNLYFASCNPYRPKKDAKILQENMNTLNELVEKATPKKPIDIEDGFGDDVHLCCPNCKKPIANVWSSAKYMPNYCHFCGQAIDWSEEE